MIRRWRTRCVISSTVFAFAIQEKMKEEEEDIDDSLKQSGGGSELLKARKRYEFSVFVFSLSENEVAS